MHSTSSYSGTAVEAASKQGNVVIVQLLLEKGADVNAQTKSGNPLHAASITGRDEIIALLLEKGAIVNAPGGHYGSAAPMRMPTADYMTMH